MPTIPNSTKAETGALDTADAWIDVIKGGQMDLETAMAKIGSSKEALALKSQIVARL